MISWPDALVEEVAERRCIFFLGAGISCSAASADGRRPPGWEEFLKRAALRLKNAADKTEVERLIGKGQLLDAAQVVHTCIDEADFTKFLKEEMAKPHFQPSKLHELIHDIDPKIVITTNYDTIYEQVCTIGLAKGAYSVARHTSNHTINEIRSPTRLIIKAHGCITEPNNIILSREQYFKAKREHPHFYSLLDALFLTNTILFLGCGLSDPDIQLTLENSLIAAPSTHPHYAVTEATRHDAVRKSIKSTFNIVLLEYPPGKHEEVVDALEELKVKVYDHRAKHGA